VSALAAEERREAEGPEPRLEDFPRAGGLHAKLAAEDVGMPAGTLLGDGKDVLHVAT
jgi:hypothetical protein